MITVAGLLTGEVVDGSDLVGFEGNVTVDSFKINQYPSDFPKIVACKNGFLLSAGYSDGNTSDRTICYFLGLNPDVQDGPFDEDIPAGKIIRIPEHMLEQVSTPLHLNSETNIVRRGRFMASIQTNEMLEQADISPDYLAAVSACVFSVNEYGSDIENSASNLAYRYGIDQKIISSLTKHTFNNYQPEHERKADVDCFPEQQNIFSI